MQDQANTGLEPEPDITYAESPAVVDRARFQAELDALRVQEKRIPAKATRSPLPGADSRSWRSTPPSD
jgi:hypothetical protein